MKVRINKLEGYLMNVCDTNEFVIGNVYPVTSTREHEGETVYEVSDGRTHWALHQDDVTVIED